MWTTIVGGTLVLNIMLLVIHLIGPKAITLTWVPGRAIILVLNMLHKTELNQWLQITWTASLIPVSFLAIFHFALRYMTKKGGQPRFSCATQFWVLCWLLAFLVMAAAVTVCILVENTYFLFAIGMVAAYLNIVNVVDAPLRLRDTHLKFTLWYVIGTNAVVITAFLTIDHLIEQGYVQWAGVASNIPLLPIVLLAGSTCSETEETVQAINQHVYMLAYQSWPAMAFVGTVWGTHQLGNVLSLSMATLTVTIVLLIQYLMVRNKL